MRSLRWIVALCFGILSGCSLTFDFTECESDSDCEQLQDGPYVCVSNACESVANEEDPECFNDTECTEAPFTSCDSTTNTCVDPSANNDDSDMGPDVTMMPDAEVDMEEPDLDDRESCSRNSECSGETELCVDEFCVEAVSQDCSAPYGDLSASNSVVLGTILPMTAPYDTIGPPLSKSIQLAVDDFNRIGGIPGGSVIWVNCNDRGNADVARRAATHLVENLGVQGIIGPLFSTPFISVVRDVTKDAGVFTISPTATADALTNLNDDGLAWRTIATDRLQAAAIVAKVRELQAESSRLVTVFYKNDAYGVGLFNELSPRLAQALGGNQNVTGVLYEDPATLNFDQAQISAEFGRAVGAAPSSANLVIMIGTSETAGLAGAYIQARGPIEVLFSHGGVTEMARIVTGNDALQPLLSGIGQNIFHPVNFGTYQGRFGSAFPGEPPLTISTLTYDATVLTLFGMASVPDGEEITGRKIADAMAFVADKDADAVSYQNSSFISEGLGKLQAGESFDYVGVSGEVDFDLATGNVVSQDFLQFTTVQDENDAWQLAPNRAFAIGSEPSASDPFGLWFDLCGPSAPFQMCSASQTCTDQVAEGSNLCVDLCDTEMPQCDKPEALPSAFPNPMVCAPTGMGTVGICVPNLD